LNSLPPTESLALSGVVASELLRSSSDLRLKRQIACALDGSQESRQILLLRFDERDPLLLQAQRVVEKSTHVLLVRLISSRHLHSELASRFPLLHHELILLWSEPRIGLRELCKLRISETEPLLGHLGRLLTKALLQRGAIRVSRSSNWLRSDRGRCKEQRDCGKSETSFDHLDHWSRLSLLSTEIAGPGSVAGRASKLFMSFIS